MAAFSRHSGLADAKRILVVVGDPAQRAVLVDLLRCHGHLVTEVASAREARVALESEKFDLLVTDYYLGGATGTWLSRVAIENENVWIPRVLLVTGYDDPLSPFDGAAFLSEVDQALETEPAALTPKPGQRIAFTLYCSDSLRSVRARMRLEAVLRDYVSGQVALSVVQVGDEAPEDDRVIATPTLLRTFPGPRVWIAGDLERTEVVRKILDKAGVDRVTR